MFHIFFFLFIFVCSVFSENQDQQIIHIRVDEELPLSTILFTTTNAINYRLFDTGRNQNSFVRYDSSTGQLLLARSIDREVLCAQRICSCTQCQLTIELIEWQTPYRLLQLILNVDDINDHIPTFSSNNYTFHIRENIPIGYEIPLEQANDADLGENSRINYELKSSEDDHQRPFELVTKINGGLILKVIKEVDREERDHYEYQLIAFDNGQPKKQSSTELFIRIDDVNDNPVVLEKSYIHLNVSENTSIGTELTRINATDKDIGLNGKIHYSISNGLPSSSWMDYFRISDSTGILSLVGPLDYESEQSYRLTIQVRDLGENSVARFVTVDVSIIDENDNQPQAFLTFVRPLLNDSIISIRENSPVGQILAYVSISDQDSGVNGEMSARIEDGNDFIGMKIIDQKSFLLILTRSIDRENEKDREDHRLFLMVTDHGQPSKSLRLEYPIILLDENDSPPVFNQSISCNLQIDSSDSQFFDENDILFEVQATDLDLGENSRLSYSILPPYNDSFGINEQGQVFLRENLTQSSFSYHLRIMAIDHGQPLRLNATQDCFVTISSVNISENLVENDNRSLKSSEKNLLQWSFAIFDHYSYMIVGLIVLFLLIILIVITVCITFCFHTFLFAHRKKNFKPQKSSNSSRQYHLYDTLHRKSPFIHDESACSSSKLDDHDDLTSEERQRLVNLNSSDQTSCESSDSMNKQIRVLHKKNSNHTRPLSDHQNFARIVRNSYPPSPFLSSMPSVVMPPPKPPRDSGYESISLLKPHQQQTVSGRPLSLSISTATTYTSSGTDSSSSPLPPPLMNTFRPPYSAMKYNVPMTSVVRLAEEEKIDV